MNSQRSVVLNFQSMVPQHRNLKKPEKISASGCESYTDTIRQLPSNHLHPGRTGSKCEGTHCPGAALLFVSPIFMPLKFALG
jgi:hypothetical protein